MDRWIIFRPYVVLSGQNISVSCSDLSRNVGGLINMSSEKHL